jgi:hypothetical protein
MTELTRWEYIRAVIAKWLVVNVAARISAVAVISLMLEVSDMYREHELNQIEVEE